MRRLALAFALVAGSLGLQPPAVSAPTVAPTPAPAQPEGTWAGTLDAGAAKLRIQIHVTRRPDGTLSGTFDSLDQGAMGLPFQRVTPTPDGLRLESDTLHVVVEGRYAEGGRTLTAEWRQGAASLPLALSRVEAPVVLRRPQEPQPPFPYRAEDVTYTNPQSGQRLAGTLTLPEGKGPFGAVLLITGSGAQDRDETIFGHKPFKLIADALTRRGVAVLRVDDRGIGGSTGDPRAATTLDFATDVKAGVDFLRHRADIDPKRVGLLGHSEGGLIAPIVAADDPKLAFVVLFAGPGVNGLETIARQTEDIMRASGKPPAEVAKGVALERRILAIAASDTPAAQARPKLLPLLAELGMSEADQAAQADALLSPWYRQFLRLDPAPYLQRLHCPVLALLGGKDTQVSAVLNQTALSRALKGHQDVTIRVLPGLNHLFQTAGTGLVNEYGAIEETMAPEALSTMVDWVVKHSAADGAPRR